MSNECLEKVTKYELSILRRLAMAQEKPEGGAKSPPPPRIGLTLAGTGYFASFLGTGGRGEVIRPPQRVWPLIELELRGINERVGLHERKPMVPNFNVSGQPMTSEVRSNTRRRPSEMTIFGML